MSYKVSGEVKCFVASYIRGRVFAGRNDRDQWVRCIYQPAYPLRCRGVSSKNHGVTKASNLFVGGMLGRL